MFGIVLNNSLTNFRWVKFCNTRHALVFDVIYHTTSITDNHRIFISHIFNKWNNFYLINLNIVKRQCHIIVGVISSERLL